MTSTRAWHQPDRGAASTSAPEPTATLSPAARVLFIHGLEGHPNGSKVRLLRSQGFDVQAPDMQMSIFQLGRRNSAIRNLLRSWELRGVASVAVLSLIGAAYSAWAPVAAVTASGLWALVRLRPLFRRAVARSFDRCVAIQAEAIPRLSPDVVVGSSWGGAVAAELVGRGVWDGPTILLAPAVHRVGDWTGRGDGLAQTERLRRRSATVPIVVFHDPGDEVVPHEDSVRLVQDSAIEFHSVSAGGHRLLELLERGELARTILRLLGTPKT